MKLTLRTALLVIVLMVVAAACERTAEAESRGYSVWFDNRDPAWLEKLSQPEYEIQFEHDLKVLMRDGIKLSANVWRPKAEGKFPVIFIYVPYDNGSKRSVGAGDIIGRAKFFVPRGYVVAAIDARGRYDSEGESYLYWHHEWKDGKFDGLDIYDSQTWLGEQPWSSGKIGMTGGSYLGFSQWMGATLANKYLTTIIPYVSPDDHYDNIYPNGAMQLSNSLSMLSILGENSSGINPDLREHWWNWPEIYRHLPIRTLDRAIFGQEDQLWQDLVDHPDNDEYWRLSVGFRPGPAETGEGQYHKVQVPSLNITGWYDQVSQATINNYLGMVQHGPKQLRDKHHLLVGPWRHGVGPRVVGDLDFGDSADLDFAWVELRWYDYWLKGIANGMMEEPPVSIFVMGENRWRAESNWPLQRAEETVYYLHSNGSANTGFGDGRLIPEVPGVQKPDSFVYDPENPVPSYGGNVNMQPPTGGPRDQRGLQMRQDVLVYTSEPLENDLEVTGRVLTTLYAASSARDTDFTAKLVDVHPDGYAQILIEGIIRGRYRESFTERKLLEPGEIYEYTIDLWSTSHVYRKGHRIQLEISSSNFPKYDRNPNTGHDFGADAELQKANQTIFHDRKHPSRILLPVVNR